MSDQNSSFVFGKKNYIAIIVGFIIVVMGFSMMAGGKSEDPNEFNEAEIFSPTRITYAPLTVLIGFTVIGVGIMLKPEEIIEESSSEEA